MCARTVSEAIFEKFCSSNAIKWERIQEAEHSTPDYKVQLGGRDVFIEIKQIDEDANFRDSNGVSTRALGQHIRAKMVFFFFSSIRFNICSAASEVRSIFRWRLFPNKQHGNFDYSQC